MTADIRAAAEKEADRRYQDGLDGFEDLCPDAQEGFALGAVWAQVRLTPTREQIAETLVKRRHPRLHWPAETQTQIGQTALRDADAILAVLGGLAEGGSR